VLHLEVETKSVYYTGNMLLSILPSMISAYLIHYKTIRPYLFSEIIILVVYAIFYSDLNYRLKTFLLFILFVFWSNLHGMAISISILFIVVSSIELICNYIMNKPINYRLTILSIICLLASLMHPTPYMLLLRNLNASSYGTIDWQSLILLDENIYIKYPLLIIYFIILLLTLFTLYSRNKFQNMHTHELLMNISYLFLSLYYYRFTWLLSLNIVYLLKINYKIKYNKYVNNNYLFVFIITILIYHLLYNNKYINISDFEIMPSGSIVYLKRNDDQSNVFTFPLWSGYVIFNTNCKIYSDSRIEPFIKGNYVNQNLAIYEDVVHYTKFLKDSGTKYIIINPKHINLFDIVLNGELEIVYKNQNEYLLKILN